jgi:hypothetical protein
MLVLSTCQVLQAFDERDAFLAHKAAVEAAAEQNERIRGDIHAALEAQTRAEAERHIALAAAAAAEEAQRGAEAARQARVFLPAFLCTQLSG